MDTAQSWLGGLLGSGDVNILLVDDREDGLVALEAVLSPLGYNLVTASTGAAALAAVLETDFAVIVLDVQMPEMDGFETAALIKSRERSRHIPILFVTAINKDPRFVYRGYEVGAVDYLFKPFDPQILRAKVDVFVDLHLKSLKLRQQSELLKAAELKMRSLLQTARDVVAMIAPNGEILSLSDAFESMTGWGKDEWIGRGFSTLSPDSDLSSLLSESGSLWEMKVATKEHGLLATEVSSKPMREGDEILGYVVVIRDITLRKEAEAVRRRAFELERSNRELEQFASVCSHDLQEPLRVISNFVPLLERRYRERLDEDGRQLLTYIEKSSKRMSELVKDLLRYSRLGSQDVVFESVDGNQTLTEAIQNLQVMVEETDAKIVCSTLPAINGNRSQLVQLFQNLIANGIKFRSGTRPVVEVGVTASDSENIFHVKDNGIGIDGKYAGRIFDIFRRLHSQEQYPGTGVGLAICKKVVDRHGGRIWVESKPGNGSTFYFAFPKCKGLVLPFERRPSSTPPLPARETH